MSSLTPNFGLYMPDPTDPYGDFITEHNNNMLIIDGNLGGGGGGGGGNTYGAFVDTSRLVYSGTYSTNLSYTATEDCFVWFAIPIASNTSAKAYIDGVQVATFWNGTASILTDSKAFYLKQGQTLSAQATNSSSAGYNVYGLVEGTNGIYTPIIYSDNERCIGVWRDNKPLYQKTVHITALPSAVGTPTGYVHNIADIDLICDFEGTIHFANGNASKFDRLAMLTNGTAGIDAVSSMVVYVSKTSIDITVGANRSTASADFTIRYTKTTDVAGSGNWNTNGVPTVHYSTNEEVIGTYLGKPLYQIMLPITQALNVTANTWIKTEYSQTVEESLVTIKMTNNSGAVIEALSGGFVDSKIAINSPRAFNMGANTGYYILQYTKTTD